MYAGLKAHCATKRWTICLTEKQQTDTIDRHAQVHIHVCTCARRQAHRCRPANRQRWTDTERRGKEPEREMTRDSRWQNIQDDLKGEISGIKLLDQTVEQTIGELSF
jgi:hypothetical protein